MKLATVAITNVKISMAGSAAGSKAKLMGIRTAAIKLPSSGRRRGPEQRRKFVGSVGDPEHRPGRLEGQARFERAGIDGVEAEAIDELHHRSDRCSVIACRRDGDPSGRTVRAPAFVELVVRDVIETLDHPRRREPFLDDDTRAGWRIGEFRVDAVDLFPIVHGIDEDLAGEKRSRGSSRKRCIGTAKTIRSA